MTLSWTGSDGYSLALDGSAGITVGEGPLGIEAPPVELSHAQFLSADGSTLVKARRGVRRVVLPLLIVDGVTAGARGSLALLLRSLMAGGSLTYTSTAHNRQLLDVYYESGAETGSIGRDPGQFPDDIFPVSLLAMDPWWYGDSSIAVLAFGTEVAFDAAISFDAAIGFDGTSANPVTIDGDADAFPTTTIDGPFTTLQVGIAGGLTFELAGPLASGDRITIDTRPGNRGPRRNSGPVDWSLLTPASRLWTLPSGVSTLNAGATGDSGASRIEVAWRTRWLLP